MKKQGGLLILSVFDLRNKPQPLQLPGVFYAGGDEVDAGSLNAGVPQHIRQLRHIPAGTVECPGEQVSQVVGEDLRWSHICFFA